MDIAHTVTDNREACGLDTKPKRQSKLFATINLTKVLSYEQAVLKSQIRLRELLSMVFNNSRLLKILLKMKENNQLPNQTLQILKAATLMASIQNHHPEKSKLRKRKRIRRRIKTAPNNPKTKKANQKKTKKRKRTRKKKKSRSERRNWRPIRQRIIGKSFCSNKSWR